MGYELYAPQGDILDPVTGFVMNGRVLLGAHLMISNVIKAINIQCLCDLLSLQMPGCVGFAGKAHAV